MEQMMLTLELIFKMEIKKSILLEVFVLKVRKLGKMTLV